MARMKAKGESMSTPSASCVAQVERRKTEVESRKESTHDPQSTTHAVEANNLNRGPGKAVSRGSWVESVAVPVTLHQSRRISHVPSVTEVRLVTSHWSPGLAVPCLCNRRMIEVRC